MQLRRIAGNAAAVLIGLFVAVSLGELLLRQFVTLPMQRIEPEIRYRPHPARRFTLLPDQVANTYGAAASIDGRGFRMNGHDYAGRANSGARILALGDSFTFGLGVGNEETWPAQLEKTLRSDVGLPVSVINAGTISYGVFQELDLLRSSGLKTQPTIVVHGLYWNDFMNAAPPAPHSPSVLTADGYFVWDRPAGEENPIRRAASKVVSQSAFLYSLRQVVSQLGRREKSTDYALAFSNMVENGLTPSEWQYVEDFYLQLKSVGDEHEFQNFVVIMPVNGIVCRPGAKDQPYPAEARRRLEALEIPYLDAFSLWAEKGCNKRTFLPQGPDAHLNAAGYQLIAEALADHLLASPVTSAAIRQNARATP